MLSKKIRISAGDGPGKPRLSGITATLFEVDDGQRWFTTIACDVPLSRDG